MLKKIKFFSLLLALVHASFLNGEIDRNSRPLPLALEIFCESPLMRKICPDINPHRLRNQMPLFFNFNPTLKNLFKDDFLIGAALNESHFYEKNAQIVHLIQTQFNSISPENSLKWASVHPKPDVYDFNASDRFVEFGEKNQMFIIGHTLIWHEQTPSWVFENIQGNPIDRDTDEKNGSCHSRYNSTLSLENLDTGYSSNFFLERLLSKTRQTFFMSSPLFRKGRIFSAISRTI